MKLTTLAPLALALGTTATLFSPSVSQGFTITNGALPVDGRHFRLAGQFADPEANDNLAPNANFPGTAGALQALWKGAAEWGSRPHGDGLGDPLQPNLGDGGANFDFYYAGLATGHGIGGSQVISFFPSCTGGTLAWVDTPTAGGWRMTVCEDWVWQDGPGAIPTGFLDVDIQAVLAHEFGHALGLGHSQVNNATMFANYFGPQGRSLEQDDIDGVQAIYGVADPSKPVITGVTLNGTSLSITGSNFNTGSNEIWFTPIALTDPNGDPTLKQTNVPATGGGQLILTTVPPGAGSGAIHVKVPGTAHSTVSNAFPLDLSGGQQFGIVAVTPTSVPALIPGTAKTVQIAGNGFDPTSNATVVVGGVTLPQSSIDVTSTNLILIDMPQVPQLGTVSLSVTQGANTATAQIDVVAPTDPVLQCGNGNANNVVLGAAGVTVTLAGQPGDVMLVPWSTLSGQSNQFGVVFLDLGSGFTILHYAGPNLVFTIPPEGWTSFVQPTPVAPTNLTIYAQAVRLTGGAPYDTSDRQVFVLL